MDENTKLRCPQCGGKTVFTSGSLVIDDKYIGKYEAPSVHYLKCPKCGEELLGNEALEEIEKAWAYALRILLGNKPLQDFMSPVETLIELGISKRKFNTIKYNTLYRYAIANTFLCLRESVEQFKKTGDGRVILV